MYICVFCLCTRCQVVLTDIHKAAVTMWKGEGLSGEIGVKNGQFCCGQHFDKCQGRKTQDMLVSAADKLSQLDYVYI